ncbi:MAG: folate-binding protein, partial [Alphaproteobacteria bacterium]|nr:folate-binding protein [Alphaproteobacteria bacterium]
EVGELRSGSGRRALALLQTEAARGAGALTADGVRIVPVIPPWMRLG